MADTFTTNYNWTKPAVGGDPDTWGGLLNTDLDGIDSTVFAVSGVANAAMPKAGGTFTGAISGTNATFTGVVTSGGTLQSSTTTCIVAPTGAGAVYLRPNGQASATGQMQVNADGSITTAGSGSFGIGTTATAVPGLGNPVIGANNLVAYNAGNIGLTLCTDSASARTQQIGFAAAGISVFAAGMQWNTSTGVLSLFSGGAARAGIDGIGNLTVTTSGSTTTIAVNDGGGNGSNIKLAGNGSTTPSKWVRAQGGNFQVMSNGYGTILNGTDASIWSAADFQATSDKRLKTDIVEYKGGLAELERIGIYEYEKHQPDGTHVGHEIGPIAQELAEILPSAVNEGADGFLTVSDRQLLALAINSIKQIARALAIEGLL